MKNTRKERSRDAVIPVRHVSTSYSERLNLEIRTKNRRLTRLFNGYSRKVANLEHSMDVELMVHDFVKRHGTHRVSPAMKRMGRQATQMEG